MGKWGRGNICLPPFSRTPLLAHFNEQTFLTRFNGGLTQLGRVHTHDSIQAVGYTYVRYSTGVLFLETPPGRNVHGHFTTPIHLFLLG